LAPKVLPTSLELRIGKRDIEPGSSGDLGETFAEDLVSVDAKAGAVACARDLQQALDRRVFAARVRRIHSGL
jgi:hypothetical protein